MAKHLKISFWIEDGPEFCPLKRAALAPERACTKASAVKWVLPHATARIGTSDGPAAPSCEGRAHQEQDQLRLRSATRPCRSASAHSSGEDNVSSTDARTFFPRPAQVGKRLSARCEHHTDMRRLRSNALVEKHAHP